MGFLHKLWDETLAGPAPDSGLGKLRKYNSFSAVQSNPLSPVVVSPDLTPVSRSITILRSTGGSGSAPVSPMSPSTPTSPFSPSTPQGEFKRKQRKKTTQENSDPVIYDWIMINALDR